MLEDEEGDADQYEGWFSEVDALPRAFCDVYVVHAPHTYFALNHNVYDCAGFTQDDLDECERIANLPPCEHGMSADLCTGPNHY